MGRVLDLEDGITSGVLRLGIKQGVYTAYVETADSGTGFQYFVMRDGTRILEGLAVDFPTAKRKAEAELKLLCSTPQ